MANGYDPLDSSSNSYSGEPEDSDGDGLSDEEENDVYFTDPYSEDTDGDGMTDGDEISGYAVILALDETVLEVTTDPLNPDTDGDELFDGWERHYGFNPVIADNPSGDHDGDGLSLLDEFYAGSDPFAEDTDEDGLPDLWEVWNALDPDRSG